MTQIGERYVVEYLLRGEWYLASDTQFEKDAVARARALWKSGVGGIRIVKVSTVVHKEARR